MPAAAAAVQELSVDRLVPWSTSGPARLTTRYSAFDAIVVWRSVTAQPSRDSRCSPTLRAFAIAVRAGFTAPMLGKKLVSTT